MSRVLSIQSHVVHGYVGNKSSSFPLQLLGFDVDQINTVQFSNHTRYKQHTGQLLSSEHLLDLVDGLEANSILHLYSHVLSGYQSASSLKVVFETVVKIKRLNPDLFYLMDPVLGDNGQLYCAPECIDLYISMCRVADLITPNDFEAKILTRVAIESLSTAIKAIDVMHSFGCPIVVITSASLTDFDSSLLTLIASFHGTKFFLKFPKISGSFTGTGDLLASLILARVTKSSDRFVFLKAVEKAISTMHAILMKTTGDNCRDRELKLIQSKREIEDPEILFQGEWIL